MKYILFFSLLFSSASYAQRSRGFLSGTFQVDAPEHYKAVVSARLSGGVNVSNLALIGIGVGVTKFNEFKKVYVPVFGTITVADFTKRISPLVVLEPGYGIYNEKVRVGTRTVTREGGFTFFGGGGVAIAASSKANISLSVGYAHYGFETGGVNSSVRGPGFRFTVTAL
jgi:opacity protein-like surface antigen